ncbi:DMT family transporter [Glaciihabitans sp. dw_435]|uniref:DMT family transporter n=1 Tax=Glaciihabitans sp. dw_435 TaxID=2720081 RepID=UPI001BD68FC6|nr:DMT family transporter [Glaciihabitans sp. dw_435]
MTSSRVLAAGLGVVVLWASAFPAISVAAPDMGVIGLSFVRLVVASAVLVFAAPFLGVRFPARRDLALVVACGFFGMTAYQLLLNSGELYVPAGTSSIIVAAAPLVSVGIAAIAFKERLSVIRILGSLVAIAGVLLVCLARAGISLSGAVWIIVAAMVVQGVYHPLSRLLLRTYSAIEVATYAMVAGTIMTLPVVPSGWTEIVSSGPEAWVAGIYLGLLPSALGFVLWGYAVARLPVVASTSLLYLVPAVAVLISFLWLGEIPVPSELLGGAVIIAGVVFISQGDRLIGRLRRRPTPASPTPISERLHS